MEEAWSPVDTSTATRPGTRISGWPLPSIARAATRVRVPRGGPWETPDPS
jgi:hypothetical protein